MRIRATWIGWAGVAVIAGAALAWAAPQGEARAPDDTAGRAELAERISALAQNTLRAGATLPRSAFQRTAALLEAAEKLNPKEPRFPRLRAEALQRLGDRSGEIDALKAYLKLFPEDPTVKARIIALYAEGIETADGKIAYYKNLLTRDLPPELKALVASHCVPLVDQRSPDEAVMMAKQAVDYYPLPEATRLYYELVAKKGTPQERVAGLLMMLKANPAQPHRMAELARLLASAGLVGPSLDWFDAAVTVYPRTGLPAPADFHELLIEYASELFIGGRDQTADTLVSQMLERDSGDADAWFVNLTLQKASSEEVAYSQMLELAKRSFVTRWNQTHDQILGKNPATQPATAPAVGAAPAGAGAAAPAPSASESGAATTEPTSIVAADPADLIPLLKDEQHEAALKAFVGVLGDLTWFELYFDNQPETAAKWVKALQAVLPADSVTVLRLDGWLDLVSKRPKEARQKLEPIRDRDPLAALGVFKLDEDEKKPRDVEAAAKLLGDYPTGLLGAMLWQELHEYAKPAPFPAAEALRAELEKFPKEWLAILDPRQVRHFYSVQAEPVRSAAMFGEPMLLEVTIQNTCDHDLTIGSDGIILPDLWFDAQVQPPNLQKIPGVAFDRITGNLVLRSRSTKGGPSAQGRYDPIATRQIVRFDQGDLAQIALLRPATGVRVNGAVITDPVPLVSHESVPGPGGAQTAMVRGFTRSGTIVYTDAARRKLTAQIATGTPAEQMQTLELLVAYVHQIRTSNLPNEPLRPIEPELLGMIRKARANPSSPSVGAWTDYLSASVAGGTQLEQELNDMAASKEWEKRLLAMFAGENVPVDTRKKLISEMAQNDPDPVVKQCAVASLDLLEHPPEPAPASTTQPAGTTPTEGPSVGPALAPPQK